MVQQTKINNFIRKHIKKVLPLMFIAPSVSKAQTVIEPEQIITEANDTSVHNPQYDVKLKPYIATNGQELPQMTAGQSVINYHKTYVGYFDNTGELQVVRTDCRYSNATDMLAGVFRAECAHYSIETLEKRQIADKVPYGFNLEEYYDYLKNPDNTIGEVIRDYCNFRKKNIKTSRGKKSVVVRAGFFQGDVYSWTSCLRASYCSPDEDVRKFASLFINDSEENLAIRDSVMRAVYKNGEFISGEEGVEKRLNIRPLLSKIRVENIAERNGRFIYLSNKFCNTLKYYTQKQEFKNETEEYNHNKMFTAVKKLQEDYVLAWYLLAGKNTMISQNADVYMANKINTKIASRTKSRVTPKQVKEKGYGIYTEPGIIMCFLESSINGGPYFNGYSKNNKANGFYPLTYNILKDFIKPFNKNKLLTEDFLRQAALTGISGAQKAYEKFKSKKEYLQKEEKDFVRNLNKNKFMNTAPQDAIKKQYLQIVKPEPLNLLKLPNQVEK